MTCMRELFEIFSIDIKQSGCKHVVALRGETKGKLRRACGGCLGAEKRRRAWRAAKSCGEPLSRRRAADTRMGQPGWGNTYPSRERSERREVKHLSTARKRNQPRFP